MKIDNEPYIAIYDKRINKYILKSKKTNRVIGYFNTLEETKKAGATQIKDDVMKSINKEISKIFKSFNKR
ncbi:hypothetical protein AQ14_225 [Francisella tularensis subsp. novicida D9876]|uniref:hypothetical protein n=1 Tax=Francisella tularensis TaxID=263 RepID=UPI0002E05A04|nr:hypothetical protein [Francisella tularensis]AJI73109.1 hypothetical protein AQ14_225 [Francisella tularensis subsp. novicida D9876]